MIKSLKVEDLKKDTIKWLIFCGSEKIGELIGGSMDSQSEFWGEYELNLVNDEFKDIVTSEEGWLKRNLILKNASNLEYVITDYLVNLRSDGKVAIRILI